MLRHWEPQAFCVNPVGYFYRREVQEKVGGFDELNSYSMDLEFLPRHQNIAGLQR